jgi:hypothetical protein
MSCRGNNVTNLNQRYKKNCKILTNFINTVKNCYDELIFKSKNKNYMKNYNKINRKNNCQNDIISLKMNKTITNNPQQIAHFS